MVRLKGVLIFAWLLGIYIHLGYSHTCNTPEQDQQTCQDILSFANLNVTDTLVEFASTIGSLMGGIPAQFKRTLLTTWNQCVFDPTNDITIANSFKFILFKPNSDQPEYINGVDLLNGCDALKSGANLATKTIWLWPGWTNNCSKVKYMSEEYFWTVENAPNLVKYANAQVLVIDWGSSGLSCCSYPILLFCHMDTISEWMAKVIQSCSTIASSTSIPNTWLIGHSLGAHMSGYTAKNLNKPSSKVEKVIGLDPAGPMFFNKIGNGKCQGIQKEYASDTMIFMTNPGGLGIRNDKLAAVNVHVNKEKTYCQYGCQCNELSCNHFYAAKTVLSALAEGNELEATLLNNNRINGAEHKITIYKSMQSGIYDIESDNNPSLQRTRFNVNVEL